VTTLSGSFVIIVCGSLFMAGFVGLLLLPSSKGRVRLVEWMVVFLAGIILLAAAASSRQEEGLRPRLLGISLSWVVAGYLAVSVITYFVYKYDKRAAGEKRWRAPGRTLHLLALLGGWPGALVAQSRLRHKTSWRDEFWFKLLTWLIVAAHLGFWLWWLGRGR
jgi:uncharacterized membrane protein YsdA (DUF1294 family)